MHSNAEIKEAISQLKERLELPDYIKSIPEYYKALEIAVDSLEMDLKRKTFLEDDYK